MKKTFVLRLTDGSEHRLRSVATVGDFVAHPPWQDPNGRKTLVVTYSPEGLAVFESASKIVKAFMHGSRSGRTLARVSQARRDELAGQVLDRKSSGGVAWLAVRRYQRILEARIYL